jgi:hypothetical protein
VIEEMWKHMRGRVASKTTKQSSSTLSLYEVLSREMIAALIFAAQSAAYMLICCKFESQPIAGVFDT